MSFWKRIGKDKIQANQNTILKKSIANSAVLPSNELLPVNVNTVCTLISNVTFQGYMACDYSRSAINL